MSSTGAPWPDPRTPGAGPTAYPPGHSAVPASAYPPGWAPPPWVPPAWVPSPPSRGGIAARWVCGAVALTTAFVLGTYGVFGLWYDAWLDENAVRVDATVVEVTWDSTLVSYPVEGDGTVEGELYFATPGVGEVVAVEYDPDDPTYVRTAGSPEDTVMGGLALGAGVLSLLVTAGLWVWAVSAGRRRERMLAAAAAHSYGGAAPAPPLHPGPPQPSQLQGWPSPVPPASPPQAPAPQAPAPQAPAPQAPTSPPSGWASPSG